MTPEEIRSWRLSRNLTQAEAARLVGVKMRTWQSWELGYRGVRPAMVMAIKKLEGLSDLK